MRITEKMSLIDKIGRELQSRFTFKEIDIFLSEYNIKPPKDVAVNSKWVYTKSALQGVSSESVLKIAEDLGIKTSEHAAEKSNAHSVSERKKPYYSVRTGKNPLSHGLDLKAILELFQSLYLRFESEGYFQEHLGFYCIDEGFKPGALGYDIDAAILIEVRKRDMTPIGEKIWNYAEDDLFDMIEFLYDHCSKPIDGNYHSYGDCGWHYQTFDRNSGRKEFREKANKILSLYNEGYELSSDGEILTLPDAGLSGLFSAPLPNTDPDNIAARIASAQLKFRRSRSSMDDRRDAIRDLADVLEYLRPKLKDVLLKKDEAALFEIANRFGFRHHDEKQQTDYDKPIFYSWIFYYYLATIHATIRLIEKNKNSASSNSN